MTRDARDKICLSCHHHTFEERYGVLCGLTSNFANFQGTCRDFNKKKIEDKPSEILGEEKKVRPIFKTSKEKKKKGFGSILGKGIGLWIIIKIIFTIIRSITE